MVKSKWLRIGQVKTAKRKDGSEFEVMELDNENLCAFIALLRKHGAEKIGSKSVDEIRAAQKLQFNDPAKLKRLTISRFEKTDEDYGKGIPNFILADILIDVEQF